MIGQSLFMGGVYQTVDYSVLKDIYYKRPGICAYIMNVLVSLYGCTEGG